MKEQRSNTRDAAVAVARRTVLVALLTTAGVVRAARSSAESTFDQALDLIHSYSGAGEELAKAMQLADGLSRSDPQSGYAQTLFAEALSTWRLDQQGQPVGVRDQVVAMADEALKLNPGLLQAHVAKARALVRSSQYARADASIRAALEVDPNQTGAIFLRAEIYRRVGSLDNAAVWYRKFIDSTPSTGRKANGYSALASMYQRAAWDDSVNRKLFTEKAKSAYESMLSIEPNGAWRNVNFAIFLNDYAEDFDGAEKYALKALGMMEFPMARYHFAAAKYQRLGAKAAGMQRKALAGAVGDIAKATGVSLDNALAFSAFSSVVIGRLEELQARLKSPKS